MLAVEIYEYLRCEGVVGRTPIEGIGKQSGRTKDAEYRDFHGRRGVKSNLHNHSTRKKYEYAQRRLFKEGLREIMLGEEAALVNDEE